jgi:hypothetical protein
MSKDVEAGYYTRGKQLTQPRSAGAFYVIETTWHRSAHDGGTYSRAERVGWLTSDPSNKVKLKSAGTRDEWTDKITNGGNDVG